jgi:Zn-dependent peptidase ImmA (M78 family)
MGAVQVKRLTDHQLRQAADSFLARTNPTGKIPVDIEGIVELGHKIDIVPVENLRASGHEAYTVRSRKMIYLDKHVYMRDDPNRRRFTLAHEIAHIELHRSIFEVADYNSIDEWKLFLASIPDGDIRELELQAYMFAGLILVPSSRLSAEYTRVEEKLKSMGRSVESLPPGPLLQVAKHLGGVFQVSHECIHRCAVRDNLWKLNDLPGT